MKITLDFTSASTHVLRLLQFHSSVFDRGSMDYVAKYWTFFELVIFVYFVNFDVIFF